MLSRWQLMDGYLYLFVSAVPLLCAIIVIYWVSQSCKKKNYAIVQTI